MGGSEPIASLTDPGAANGCAFDPMTGNLAVANNPGTSVDGNVAIFQGAQGTPTIYFDSSFQRFVSCAYDNLGNLYADGVEPGNVVDELPKGGDELTEIQLSTTINPGSLQWLRRRLVAATVETTSRGSQPIYNVKVSGNTGSVRGPILLSSSNDRRATGAIQFWIQNKTIIGPGHLEGRNGSLQFWKYPQGDLPTKVIKPNKHDSFFGVAISRGS